jgi:uncharacterized protein
MIEYKEITVDDKDIITSFTLPNHRMNCDLSFSNLLSWRFMYDTVYAVVEGFLVLKFYDNGELNYVMPIGKGNMTEVLNKMIDDAHAEKKPFRMTGVAINMEEDLEKEMQDRLLFTSNRDYSDYIYLRTDLAGLKGKKFQQKRNHVNKFKKTYLNWEYKPATPALIQDCLEMERQWCIANGCDKHEDLAHERRSLIWALHHAKDVELLGGVLYVDRQIVAFTFGAPINNETFGVHFEKADVNTDGAYTIINQEFAKHIPEQYIYVNREEDLGLPGLRKAKLSYNPTILLEKGIATLKDEMIG